MPARSIFRSTIVGLAALAMWAGGAAAVLLAQGYSPLEATRHMRLPEGLVAELVAAEPQVRQPVAIEFDDRGRLWVIQYLQYPNPAELKRAKVDRYSRTTYDRVPEPPPRGPKGNDRLTILEDDDGDGAIDRTKDFVAGLNLASGLAFGHGGVFVIQVPYLLFYADRNGDDVPDGEPDVLLAGFGMEDAHSVANSLTWGPDGWLYGCQGSTVTSNIRGIEFQQGVWRYHPLSHRFELFCEGGGNSWGLDFDRHGNLFYSTNYGGYAMLHGVQGGYYWKQFGKHGALHNPFAYGYFDHVPHRDLRGGHVTVGGVIYQGTTLPTPFRDTYIAADLLGHAAYWHTLEPRGSTFSAAQAGDLLLAGDTWFAPSDVTVGPDGAIYICDWHDSRTAHPDPDAQWDRSNGRIYRIRSAAAARVEAPDLPSLSSAGLVAKAVDNNSWIARKSRRLLADRRDPQVILPLRRMVFDAADDSTTLQYLWTLYVVGGLSDGFAGELLSHPSADVRWWTVRMLGDENRIAADLAVRFVEMARTDPSVAVRSQLASTARRLPTAQALPIIEQLLARDEDASDPYLPLLLWWAVEQHAIEAQSELVALVTWPSVRERPLVRGTIGERLLRRYAATGSESGYLACAQLLAGAAPQDRAGLLAALDQGLGDRQRSRGGTAGTLFAGLAQQQAENVDSAPAASNVEASIPAALGEQVKQAWSDDTRDGSLIRLAVRFGWQQGRERAVALASDHGLPPEQRLAAINLLGELGKPWCAAPLLALVDATEQRLAVAAIAALAGCDEPSVGTALLKKYPKMAPALKAKTCDVLLARKAWAHELLAAVEQGRVPTKEISLNQLRLVALHADAELDRLVKKHWGSVQSGTSEERLAEMRRINNDLRAAPGNASAGKALFTKQCGTCHRLFGEGTEIGPELTHANRKNTDELLATIVNPSTVIRKEYMNFVAQTTDGRVLTGLLVEQSPSQVTLLGAKNERTTVARDKIESLEESPTSLMPENLLSELGPQALRDLFAYLQSDPPPAAAQP